MKINIQLLLVISDVIKSVPLRTPDRMNVIFQFSKEIWDCISAEERLLAKECIIDMHDESSFEKEKFYLNLENIVRLSKNIPVFSKMVSQKCGKNTFAYHALLLWKIT